MYTFDLGKWHPELGPYGDWEDRKLVDFVKNYVIIKIERVALDTGGTLLLVDGHRKGKDS